MNRLESLNGQFSTDKSFASKETVDMGEAKTCPEIVDFHPNRGIKLDYFNKQGWGYSDSGFQLTKDKTAVKIAGNRYMYGGEILPDFAPWVEENLGVDLRYEDPAQSDMEIDPPNLNVPFGVHLSPSVLFFFNPFFPIQHLNLKSSIFKVYLFFKVIFIILI